MATMFAICSGDIVTNPWPMERLSVSPPSHFMWRVLCFHSGVGRNPARSSGRSMPVTAPRPKSRAKEVIVSTPSSLPMVKKYTSQDCARPPIRSR